MLATDASWPEKKIDAVVSTDEDVSWQTGTMSTWVGGVRRVVCVSQEDNESWPLWRSKNETSQHHARSNDRLSGFQSQTLGKASTWEGTWRVVPVAVKKMVVALDQMSL